MGHLVEVALRAARRRRNSRRCHLLWRLKPNRVVVCRLHRCSNRRLEICRHSWRRHNVQICQPHYTPSRLQVSRRVRPLASRRARSILTSAIALRSRTNVWSTPQPLLVSPLINRHKFHSSWGSLNQALFQQRFRCWLARLEDLLLCFFFHCHQKKKNWLNNSYAWSMILSLWWLILNWSVTGMWKNIQTMNILYFVICHDWW